MGIYSVYTGLIYNEFFSIPMQIFGGTHFRCWQPMVPKDPHNAFTNGTYGHMIDPVVSDMPSSNSFQL